jgi:hypothetical protein
MYIKGDLLYWLTKSEAEQSYYGYPHTREPKKPVSAQSKEMEATENGIDDLAPA